jgi:hypothetical protein
MCRNHLKGREGGRTNAVLAAADYNFSLLPRGFRELLRALLLSSAAPSRRPPQIRRYDTFFTADCLADGEP